MSVPPTRAPRVARAAGATALAVLVALAAHLAGGGGAPPVPVVLVVAVLVLPVAVLLTGRRARLWRQAAVTGLAQSAMHGLFALAAGPAVQLRSTAMPGMAEMSAGHLAPAAEVHSGEGMLAAHVAAWLVTVVLWRRGEAAVTGLLAGVLAAVRLLVAALDAPTGPRPVATAITAVPLPHRWLRADPRRGPPLPC